MDSADKKRYLLIGFVCVYSIVMFTQSRVLDQSLYMTSAVYQSTNLKSDSPLKQTHAVVHMGPHKTGTTSIQEKSQKYSAQLKKDGYEMPWQLYAQLKKDGYEMPRQLYKNLWGIVDGAKDVKLYDKPSNQVNFATCFLPTTLSNRKKYPCAPDLLLSGLKIAERKSNIFITAEVFDAIDETGIKLLSQYLSHWDDATVVVYYRRYYDWLGSWFNEMSKYRSLKTRVKHGIDWYEGKIVDIDIVDNITSYVTGITDTKYTFHLVQRLEKYFDNVVVMNMHDKSKDFYCDAMPHTNHTCKASHNLKEESHQNSRKQLIYSDLAYGASKKGLIAIKTDKKMNKVARAVKKFQEVRLGLTSNDFKMICLLPETKKKLLEKSLAFEKAMFPEFFSSPLGEANMRSDFEKQAKSVLCKIDADSVLGETVWQEFFESLKMKM